MTTESLSDAVLAIDNVGAAVASVKDPARELVKFLSILQTELNKARNDVAVFMADDHDGLLPNVPGCAQNCAHAITGLTRTTEEALKVCLTLVGAKKAFDSQVADWQASFALQLAADQAPPPDVAPAAT